MSANEKYKHSQQKLASSFLDVPIQHTLPPLSCILSQAREMEQPNDMQQQSNPDMDESCDSNAKDDNSSILEWINDFITNGFDATNSPYRKLCRVRRGRWTREEIVYAIRLIHELLTAKMEMPTCTTIVKAMCFILHTTSSRISKKFKNHPVLRQYTQAKNLVGRTRRNSWDDVVFDEMINLQQEAMCSSVAELRNEFLASIRFDISLELRHKKAASTSGDS